MCSHILLVYITADTFKHFSDRKLDLISWHCWRLTQVVNLLSAKLVGLLWSVFLLWVFRIIKLRLPLGQLSIQTLQSRELSFCCVFHALIVSSVKINFRAWSTYELHCLGHFLFCLLEEWLHIRSWWGKTRKPLGSAVLLDERPVYSIGFSCKRA